MGGGVGKITGDTAEVGSRDFALLGGPLRGVGGNVRDELVEADRHLLHEILVVALFGDNDVDHGENEGHVGPGLDRIPLIGLGRGLGKARIEINQLAHPAVALEQVDGVGGNEGFAAIGAAHDNVIGVENIGGRIGAEGGGEALNVRGETERCVAQGVGRTVTFRHLVEEVVLEGPLGRGENHAGARVLLGDLVKILADQIEGLVPACPPPLPLAALTDPDQRILEAVGIIDHLGPGIAAGAKHGPALDGEIGIGVELVDHPVAHPGDDAAFVDAHAAAGEDILGRQGGDRPDLALLGQGPQDLDLGADCHPGEGAGGDPDKAAATQFFFK